MIKIPISRPHIWGTELQKVEDAIRTGEISGNAKPVRDFENQCADYLGRKHAVSTANGTLAIQLALLACDFDEKSEVLVPSYCMMSPVFAAITSNLKVVPVEIDDSWNIDPERIEEKINSKTVAILAVHNYGLCSDMIALEAIAKKYSLALIEDAAEAFGASFRGQNAGTFGDASCFSLYANKAITTGEGGIVVTDRDDLAVRMRFLRNLSFGSTSEQQYEHSTVGVNYRLSALQASFGLGQLEFADAAIASKREIGLRYVEQISKIEGFNLQIEKENTVHAYWAIAGTLDQDIVHLREKIQKSLRDQGIGTRRFFCPVHRHSSVSSNIHRGAQPFRRADDIYEAGICLPSFIGMTREEISIVCETLDTAINKLRN